MSKTFTFNYGVESGESIRVSVGVDLSLSCLGLAVDVGVAEDVSVVVRLFGIWLTVS
ncbi:MAG: hypothetical protein WCO45_12240 [Pseudanabaena sp. ELA607]